MIPVESGSEVHLEIEGCIVYAYILHSGSTAPQKYNYENKFD